MTPAIFIAGLEATTPPAEIPNPTPLEIPGWTLGDDEAPVDVAALHIPVHCLDVLDRPSDDGGHFVHAYAVTVPGAPAETVRPRLSTTVTGLVPDQAYRLTFEQSLVRHHAQSAGYWQVTLGDAVVDGPQIGRPAGNPEMRAWSYVVLDGLVPGADTVELAFEAVSLGNGYPSTTLPQKLCLMRRSRRGRRCCSTASPSSATRTVTASTTTRTPVPPCPSWCRGTTTGTPCPT